MLQMLRERAVGTLTTASYVHHSCCPFFKFSFLYQCGFREFGVKKTQIRPRLTFAPDVAYHVHIICLLADFTAGGGGKSGGVITGLHNRGISARTVRKRLREHDLHTYCSNQDLDLMAACCRNQLEWANAHLWWWWGYGVGRHKDICDPNHVTSIVQCQINVFWDKTAHFGGACYCDQVRVLLFNQHLNMPHLSGGSIILAKEKRPLM